MIYCFNELYYFDICETYIKLNNYYTRVEIMKIRLAIQWEISISHG